MRVLGLAAIGLFVSGCGPSEQQLDLLEGEQIVAKNCKVCHAPGINGAPIIGNKKMWLPRIDKGVDQLVVNASNGVGLMPAKGGNSELTEAEISLAVNYFLAQVQVN